MRWLTQYKASLRARLFLSLLIVNALVLGGLAFWAGRDQASEMFIRQTGREKLLLDRLQQFQPEQTEDLAAVLRWPLWGEFEDALVVDQSLLEIDDQVLPVGTFLNPVGRRHRPVDFPVQEVTRALYQSIHEKHSVQLAGGVALPIYKPGPAGSRGEAWGGVFVKPRPIPDSFPLYLRFLFAGALTTLVGVGILYFFLGRSLLRPVEGLARAAHDFGDGLNPLLPKPTHSRELDELLNSFENMMHRIQGFQQELKSEVDSATQRASSAERRAARQDRLAAMGTLAAGLAHEINSPLAGALQGLEILRENAQGEKAERYGALTSEALERISQLVRRLLLLAPSHVEAGDCLLVDAVKDLPDFLSSQLQGHKLHLVLPPTPMRVRASAGDLFPVFLNLIRNAIDALGTTHPNGGGNIWLDASLVEEQVEIKIWDDGPGADEDLLPHLFEPFVTDKEVGAGTGLGLALAYATVRQLSGMMEASNKDEGGLVVTIRLPQPTDEEKTS
ncbi:MAG: HAMP domain-containing sensor histidine kinase [Planctomycetota bacterium]|jgi:signal transduction histidine kinase|nr:HAMP domain-containing sensor histidine kinase [Planctomycetota bacterium]MDP6942162.1 HAMP domain-containing sensor histidine kinase [Planctomycetota bacterium]